MRTRGTTTGGRIARYGMGGLLVVAGALAGAFGAVAWLSALRIQSFPLELIGVVLLGLVPIVLGLGLVWTGLGVLEMEDPPREHSDAEFLAAASSGATREEVARSLGTEDARETERRLDDLVVRDVLELDVTEEGSLVYRARVDSELRW